MGKVGVPDTTNRNTLLNWSVVGAPMTIVALPLVLRSENVWHGLEMWLAARAHDLDAPPLRVMTKGGTVAESRDGATRQHVQTVRESVRESPERLPRNRPLFWQLGPRYITFRSRRAFRGVFLPGPAQASTMDDDPPSSMRD